MPLVRDEGALTLLKEQVFPCTFASPRPSGVRAWVPRCASGEDAYTLAMLLCAYVEEHRLASDLRVFASDLDDHALGTARAGVYPASVRKEFAGAGLERFFREEEGGFRVLKRVRDCVLLSSHDFLADPPFPRLDLILCGTSFSDLPSEDQGELLRSLHYSLVDEGFLMLPARPLPEGVDAFFAALDREKGIFRRRQASEVAPLAGPPIASRRNRSARVARRREKRDSERPGLGGTLERFLLEAYAPACLVINEDQQIVYSHGKVSPFFQHPQGLPTNELLLMAKPRCANRCASCFNRPGEARSHRESTASSWSRTRVGPWLPSSCERSPLKEGKPCAS
jgi:two-component system CheB/CheR fusion protein